MARAQTKPTVAVLGAGAGGIVMGIRLQRAGYDFTIYEKSDGVGGTWRDNTYPGAACDVPSHLYSYSFAPNPWWSRTYATQPEILAYLERCTDQFGVRPHVRTGTAITEARWDDADAAVGADAPTPASSSGPTSLVSGLGMLNVPDVPEIPGADRFRGRAFHSSRWDHSKSDRRRAGRVDRHRRQRHPVRAGHRPRGRARHRVPAHARSGSRRGSTRPSRPSSSAGSPGCRSRPGGTGARSSCSYERARLRGRRRVDRSMQTELARSYLARKIEDPELRAALTPDYPVGCKRPLISRQWFPTLTRPDVRLVTEPIVEITETGLRTADGELHEVDTIVYGTGLQGQRVPLAPSTWSARAVAACTTTGGTGPRPTSGCRWRATRTSSCCTARTPTA